MHGARQSFCAASSLQILSSKNKRASSSRLVFDFMVCRGIGSNEQQSKMSSTNLQKRSAMFLVFGLPMRLVWAELA